MVLWIPLILSAAGPCSSQDHVPQLSVGNPLIALTDPTAFERQTSHVQSLRSNFDSDVLLNISQGAQEFALDLLQRISVEVHKTQRDFMVSPFSVWSLLVLLYEGSSGETYNQLRRALRINVEDEKLRGVYQVWNSYLK